MKAPSTKERVPVLPALLPAVFLPVGVAAPEQLLPTTNTKSDRLELLSNMVEHISAERQVILSLTFPKLSHLFMAQGDLLLARLCDLSI